MLEAPQAQAQVVQVVQDLLLLYTMGLSRLRLSFSRPQALEPQSVEAEGLGVEHQALHLQP